MLKAPATEKKAYSHTTKLPRMSIGSCRTASKISRQCSSVQHFTTSAEIASDSVVAATVTNACIRKSATRKALTIINQASEKTLGMPFSKAIIQYCPEEKVILKATDAERKRKQRQIMRKCTRHIENQMGQREALNMLAENQSQSSYKRMRISQSFETPEAKRVLPRVSQRTDILNNLSYIC